MKSNNFWLEQSKLVEWYKKPSFAYQKKKIITWTGIPMVN